MTGTAQSKSGDTASAGGGSPGAAAAAALDPKDLALVDDRIEDEGKDDAQLWDEIEAEEAAARGDDPAAATAAQEGDKAAAEKSADAAAAAEDSGTHQDEAAAAGEAKPGTKAKQDEPAKGEDLWANATPEQRAAYDKLVQSERSQRGRVSALQRQVDEAQKRGPQAPAAAGKANGTTAKKGTFESEKGKSFKTEYPEVAAPVAEEIETLRAELAEAKTTLEEVKADRRKVALEANVEQLEEEHEDWREVAAKPEFAEWLEDQPAYVQQAAVRNATEIVDAREAADIIGRFKADRSTAGGNAHQAGPSEGEQGNSRTNGQGTTGNALAAKRARQLESASGSRSGGPGVTQGIPEDGDPQAIWDAFEAQEQRQARRA